MTPMVWNFIIIGAVVLIFLILVRRLPIAAKFLQKEKIETTPEAIVSSSLMSQADDAFEAKKYDKAEQLYIGIAAHDPKNVKIYNRLGTIYIERKNYYDAKDAFVLATKLDPMSADNYIGLGQAYMGLKDYFKASQTFLQAIEIDPKDKKYREFYEKSQKLLEREKGKRR